MEKHLLPAAEGDFIKLLHNIKITYPPTVSYSSQSGGDKAVLGAFVCAALCSFSPLLLYLFIYFAPVTL